MKIFALSDLHLSFSGKKPMDVFGPHWQNHAQRVADAWRQTVGENDIVCMPGDFSWAMKLEEAADELAWLAALPGRKILIKGNHDYWWASAAKLKAAMPQGVFCLNNDALKLDDAWFCGARGWIDPTLDFDGLSGHPKAADLKDYLEKSDPAEDKRIYDKELSRLGQSLARIPSGEGPKIALLHYPPTSPALEDTPVTRLLEEHRVDVAVFGHLHRAADTSFKNPFGEKGGVRYYLTSADFVDFSPVEIQI